MYHEIEQIFFTSGAIIRNLNARKVHGANDEDRAETMNIYYNDEYERNRWFLLR